MLRREFIQTTGLFFGAAAISSCATRAEPLPADPLYSISLAQWAINTSFRDGTLDNLDFARVARENGYEAIEYVNQFFMDRAKDSVYLAEMNRVADGEGITNVLIMIDGEGRIGDPDAATRRQAAENHFKWVEAAKELGCHAIRVNAFGGPGSFQEQLEYAADGYGRIVAFGAEHEMNVIIENHGGYSSDPAWLKALMERIDHPRAGLLPDFGNFTNSETDPPQHFDPYEATRICMPFARGVSVKDRARMPPNGEGGPIDLERMMRIVLDSGWRGYAGVEYGGLAGIRGAREALEQIREKLAAEFA